MFKSLYSVVATFIFLWFIYMTIATIMYTYRVADFYDVDYSFGEHGIALNGRTAFGNQINVTDLAVSPIEGGGNIQDWCPGVESKRGFLTMGFVGEDEQKAVCCYVSDYNQWLVPFKDVGDTRHYLCGKWPHLDHVTQPISQSKLNI